MIKKRKRYFKEVTKRELNEIIGFNVTLANEYRNKRLYVRVKKNGGLYNPKDPLYYHEGEIRVDDVIYSDDIIATCTYCKEVGNKYCVNVGYC